MTATSFYRTVITSLLFPLILSIPGYSALRHRSTSTASVEHQRAASPLVQNSSERNYVIGDGDLLAINVWNEPDFKQSLPVRPDGKITLPLIGAVQAAGKTPSQLEKTIETKLEAYIHNPNVAVMVLTINSRKFNILGRVAKPGSYPLSGNVTVLDAIAEAGGFTPFAKVTRIYILRQNPGGGDTRIRFNYKAIIKGKHQGQNIFLQPQDTVVVP
jgi:polysaccharide export outer membrane protein